MTRATRGDGFGEREEKRRDARRLRHRITVTPVAPWDIEKKTTKETFFAHGEENPPLARPRPRGDHFFDAHIFIALPMTLWLGSSCSCSSLGSTLYLSTSALNLSSARALARSSSLMSRS